MFFPNFFLSDLLFLMNTSITNSESLFTINDDVETLYSGVAFFVLSMFIFPLYFLIMTVISNKYSKTPSMTYKLMNIINFLQLSQGIGHFITSPILIFPRMLIKFDVAIRVSYSRVRRKLMIFQIIGCIMNSFWLADLPVMALLAVCRIFIFCNIIGFKTFHISIKVVLSLIFSWIFFIILVGCVTQNVKMSPPMWGYDFEVPYASTFDTLEIFLSFPCLLVSYLSYLTIIYLIYGVLSLEKLQDFSFYFQKRNFHSTAKSRKNEVSILLQYTFVTVYISFMVIIWHPVLFSILPFIDMTNKTNQAMVNGLWILHCYVNPVMMLLFNRCSKGSDFEFKIFFSGPSEKMSKIF
ncbi:CRE-SRT-69 protein [Caenorhabditis remanei]|uniref:CRE-SRT-69 protein n=1 Tax=Caenorhabditis remanei TaxID=31234 RepID=E3LP46_CAERE|nr:CRE-SRT-69 protein [Caenorhabditis remanei]